MAYAHYSDPLSLQYQFRNPLGLHMFCTHAQFFKNCPTCKFAPPPQIHQFRHGRLADRRYDEETGLLIFNNHIQGYQKGLADLEIKCSGKSKSQVRATSSIKELIRAYYLPDGTAPLVARYLRKALADESITDSTPINYFAPRVAAREEAVNAG
jgi:hypothetical protein